MSYRKDKPEFQSNFNIAEIFGFQNAELLERGHKYCEKGQYLKWREVLFILERRLSPFYYEKEDWIVKTKHLKQKVNQSFVKYGKLKNKLKDIKGSFEGDGKEDEFKIRIRKSWGEIYSNLDEFERFVLFMARKLDLLLPEKTSSSYFGN